MKPRLLFIVNVDWFFVSHRLPIALAAIQAGYEVHLASRMTGQESLLRAHGIVLHPLPIERGSAGPALLLKEFIAIYRVMRTVKADIAHLVTVKPVLAGGIAARLTQTGGVLAAISGLGTIFLAKGAKALLRRMIVEKIYRLALGHKNMRVVVQNGDDSAALEAMTGLPATALAIIPGSGVDTDVFVPTNEKVASKPVVMLAGRLLKDKGVVEFCDAAHLLAKDNTVAATAPRFVLVGAVDPDNPSSVDVETINAWRKEGLIEIWGQKTDMASTLREADIVVLPSYREGMPKVLQEAAACGKAVVTTDVPGCRDVIIPERTGVLVKHQDSRALANAIRRLIIDPALRKAMGDEGRKLALDKFRVEVICAMHMSLYAELSAASDRNSETCALKQ